MPDLQKITVANIGALNAVARALPSMAEVSAEMIEGGAWEITLPAEMVTLVEGAASPDAIVAYSVVALAALKVRLKVGIDEAAETERLKYITAGAGQAMTYQQKTTEAVAFLAAEDPDADDYPMLSAEVGITGATIAEVATVVKAAFDQWQMIGAAIEAARLGAKVAITAADTTEAAQAAFNAVIWPAP